MRLWNSVLLLFLLVCGARATHRKSSYKITLDYVDVCHWDRLFFFRRAAKKWTKTIVEDVPDVNQDLSNFPGTDCGPYPNEIDDIYVCCSYKPFGDGLGGVIAAAMPTLFRNNSMAFAGFMMFDADDIQFLKQFKALRGTILHEVGHLLGLNNQVWEKLGITGSINDDPPCPYRLESNATREWQRISGCTDSPPPMETSFPGNLGVQCSHWDEECLREELMTGTVEGDLHLSRITVGALEDIGYNVDYDSADSYTAEDIKPSCLCSTTATSALRPRVGSPREIGQGRRILSPNEISKAKAYGKALLKRYGPSTEQFHESTSDIIVGQTVMVYYMGTNGAIQGVEVTE